MAKLNAALWLDTEKARSEFHFLKSESNLQPIKLIVTHSATDWILNENLMRNVGFQFHFKPVIQYTSIDWTAQLKMHLSSSQYPAIGWTFMDQFISDLWPAALYNLFISVCLAYSNLKISSVQLYFRYYLKYNTELYLWGRYVVDISFLRSGVEA